MLITTLILRLDLISFIALSFKFLRWNADDELPAAAISGCATGQGGSDSFHLMPTRSDGPCLSQPTDAAREMHDFRAIATPARLDWQFQYFCSFARRATPRDLAGRFIHIRAACQRAFLLAAPRGEKYPFPISHHRQICAKTLNAQHWRPKCQRD